MSDFLTATLVCLESNRGRESPPATLNLGTIVMDNQPMLDLIFRTRFRWKLRPRHMTGDTKYGTIENIKALEEAGIRAYVPLPNWEERYEVWSASHFHYEAQADQYRCPQGQLLPRVGGVTPDG